ncbi:radical SAM/SPASM domain-containing protein [Anabaena lutea]|uniref:Radical SAM protein n=1 Tax=Anabaena lutea FACHB-196 TaxID=2692881 RepID=A0ABR8FIQ8_9NOST|nr:radical SAM protein [Anabaena lutea]MBD2569853.1 radical SAM protein [Anabaena lutea FACHB-196]
MIIKDPQQLLPNQRNCDWAIPEMILEIPAHNVPLHPKSIEKLLITANAKKQIIAFQPILPVASELGLPSYPILAYLYPQELSHIWHQLRQKIELQTQENLFTKISYTLISQTDIDEQIHYFANYYGVAVKPSYVRVIVGNTCNLKCVMCPYHSAVIKPTHSTDFFKGNKAMSWQMMQKLAKECGEAKIGILVGSIEEPILHPKIVEFVQLCKQQGVPRVHITTNGQLLDKTCSQALLEAGLTSIDISIDAATPDTYRKVRGADFNRVISNVINFIQLRDKLNINCEIRTSFVRNKNVSLEEEEQFREYWLSKINSIFILNLAEYKESNMRLKTMNEIGNSSLQYYKQKADGRWPCLFPFTEIVVLPDGAIYYCIETLFRLGFEQNIESLGNYNEQTLENIWCGDLFNRLRQNLILNQLENTHICKNCDTWTSQVMTTYIEEKYQVLTTTITEIYQKMNSNDKGYLSRG